jgi:F-type H+-transporting ATPase subunit a
MSETVVRYLPYIVIVNFLLVALLLVVLGKVATTRPLKEVPDGLQNAAELALDWFVTQARGIDPRRVTLIAPFLATLFLLILGSNLLAILPIPILRIPPTSYFSGPLALALVAVLGGMVVSARMRGGWAVLKHLFWPNPLQLVSEVSHTLSLSLRLYGNIGGEFIVATLAAEAAPYGIPIITHALGLIPASVQPLVFTLLTVNFLATTVHTEGKPAKHPDSAQARDVVPPGSDTTARAR